MDSGLGSRFVTRTIRKYLYPILERRWIVLLLLCLCCYVTGLEGSAQSLQSRLVWLASQNKICSWKRAPWEYSDQDTASWSLPLITGTHITDQRTLGHWSVGIGETGDRIGDTVISWAGSSGGLSSCDHYAGLADQVLEGGSDLCSDPHPQCQGRW